MSRAMMVCEDVNITAGGGGPPSDHGGLAFGDLGPLIGMAEEDCCNTLFCVPASKQRFVPVVVGQQPVWQPPQPRAERVVPSNGEWECSEGPRLPRVVRRGVGGLKWEQTDRCTSTTPPAEPKCLFKRTAIAKQCFIYADMPRLMRCEMCGYANTRGYCGYGSESEEGISLKPFNNIGADVKTIVKKEEVEDVCVEKTDWRSPPLLLPPPEAFITNSHAFMDAAANASIHRRNAAALSSLGRASSGVFFCPCSECLADPAAAVWDLATGAESSFHNNNCSSRAASCYSAHSSSSSVASTRPPSAYFPCSSFPSPSNWPQEQQQFQSSPPPQTTFSSCTGAEWKAWIDGLVQEVQAEVRAEQQLFCQKRKFSAISNSSSNKQQHTCSPDACSSFGPSSVCSGASAASTNSGISSAYSPGPGAESCASPIAGRRHSASSNTSTNATSSPPPCKRAKKNSLVTLSQEALAERKKQQNRAAAQRYRCRKTRTMEQERDEIGQLERQNAEMRAEQAQLAKQIAALRAQLLPGGK